MTYVRSELGENNSIAPLGQADFEDTLWTFSIRGNQFAALRSMSRPRLSETLTYLLSPSERNITGMVLSLR